MKYKLTKEEFEALDEASQKEYALDGDTATLVIEGDDAPTAEALAKSEQKRQIEVEHRKAAEAKVREAEDRAAQLQKDLESAGDNKEQIEQIKADHAKQIEQMRTEREAEAAKVKQERNAAMVREEAEKFSNGHFTIPGLITDQVAKRLAVEEVDGKPVIRVINADGSPSTAALADLQKEFLDNKDFAPIIKANVGSGGGASPNKGGGATQKKLSEMNATEQAAFEKEDPEGYAAAVDATEG